MHTAHHTALASKHATLDRQLADELHRPHPDAALVAEIKRRKLRVKEAIAGL